ncbi:methyltransferase-like protein 25 [Tachyglossus aculeatus]|uniref:methyltransferase-like protein 25 n=1 Tax=Tachyglossus aculeatus TaxID=9261 RepID=UPI0018F58EE7|nr:methyltransferase-like protein 25 [Tachyglossus aculeatus]
MAAPWRPAVGPELGALQGRLSGLLPFLRRALPISGAHAVDFYSAGLWRRLVDAAPDAALEALRRAGVLPGGGASPAAPRPEAGAERPLAEHGGHADTESICNKIFGENGQKLVDVESFALIAKYYSLPNLGVCTPYEQLQRVLNENQQSRTVEKVKLDEFMNIKKSHEVKVMSELVGSIAEFGGIKQVVDLGSGKGYLSSFLSLRYGLKVYGIDSSNTNTHGAQERNRKLKKHWKAYQSHAKADASKQLLEKAKERTLPDKMNYEADCNEKLLSPPHIPLSPDKRAVSVSSSSDPTYDFTDPADSNTIKQTMDNLRPQSQIYQNTGSENVFPFISILPVDAAEVTALSKTAHRQLYGEDEKNREKKNLETRESKPSESNIYSPLTSHITAESELRDIIPDLEDCIIVGLHTCGDLAPNTLRIFAAKSEIKAICNVGCCYHLLSEEYENPDKESTLETWGFPMCRYLKEERWCCGHNARMSACLALERVAVGQRLPIESLFYRAVLQVIIKECYGISKCDQHVGKIYSKSSSFVDYVRKSLKKLGLDESKVTEKCIMDYHEKYRPRMNELEAFNMLKVVLAPCIETLILLDRLCYLKEQDSISWSALVRLFDPVKSPRCYAVVAVKK